MITADQRAANYASVLEAAPERGAAHYRRSSDSDAVITWSRTAAAEMQEQAVLTRQQSRWATRQMTKSAVVGA